MSFKSQKILGIYITITSVEESLEEVQKYLKKVQSSKFKVQSVRTKPFVIFTPNPEIIAYAQKDREFKQIVNKAQINLPDGAGVVWALKKLYGLTVPKIAGADFMEELVNLAEKQSLRIGLIGGRGDLADTTSECLQAKHPDLKAEVFDAPEAEIKNEKLKIKKYNLKFKIQQESDKDTSDGGRLTPLSGGSHDSSEVEESKDRYFNSLVQEIIDRKLDILFVALGFPKQEYFIENIKYQISNIKYDKPLVLMAVGGAFDYISGRVPRAPLFIRNLGLEWLFRLILEPWRLSRQLEGAKFFLRVAFPSLFPIQYPQ